MGALFQIGIAVDNGVEYELSAFEGEGNHSTSVISRLGLVEGGGAVVMV